MNRMKSNSSNPGDHDKQRLQGKESTRTTFNLPDTTHKDIKWLAKFYKIKVKEVFDEIFSTELFREVTKEKIELKKELYEAIKGDPKLREKLIEPKFIRKTYVLSRKSLRNLEGAAKRINASRDLFVEYLIDSIRDEANEEKEHKLESLKIIKEFLDEIAEKAYEVEKKIEKLIGPYDPIYEKFFIVTTQVINFENNFGPFKFE